MSVSEEARRELPPVNAVPPALRGGTISNRFAALDDDGDDDDDHRYRGEEMRSATTDTASGVNNSPNGEGVAATPAAAETDRRGAPVDSDNSAGELGETDDAHEYDQVDAIEADGESDSEQDEPTLPRRSNRIAELKARFALHASLRASIQEYGQRGRDAAMKEINQLLGKRVFEPVSPHVKVACIPSKLFLKEKRNAAGEVIKVKGRLVAGGHRQLRGGDDDNSSPTVSTEGLLTVLAVSASKGHVLRTVDVEGAYLECDMPSDVYMRLGSDVSELLLEADPNFASYVRADGSIAVRLRKALYGTVQASRLWYEKISGILISNGFRMNSYDKCIFYKRHNGDNIVLTLHVDDVLVSSTTHLGADYCSSILKRSFSAINESSGADLEYLGIKIQRGRDGVLITMPGYTQDCIQAFSKHDRVGTYNSPCDTNLFVVDNDSPPLSAASAEAFHSIVAKVLYLATKVRPDLTTAVSFLCSRVQKSTNEDWKKLKRVISYLATTVNHGILYSRGQPAELSAYVDAGHGTHAEDGTSRTGIIVTLAGGAVCWRSNRQSLVTLSSTEAELVGLAEGSNYVLWLRNIMRDLQLAVTKPTVVYQDNESTIKLIFNEKTKQQRTRHMNCKYFAIRERIRQGEIELRHMPGVEIPADMLTKGVEGSALRRLLPRVMCIRG
jgi:hypothetical protein